MAPNNRFFLTLLQYYSRNHAKQGFVLPTLIGLGLIMTVVGLTMIGRSSNDQQTAISQKQSAQAQAVAEAGVSEVMQFMNSVPAIADDDLENWENEYEQVKSDCVSNDSNINDYAQSNWVELNNPDNQYRVLNYTPGPPEGTLRVEGRSNFNSDNPSTSILEVTIPVNNTNQPVPGLFVEEAELSGGGGSSGDGGAPGNNVDGDVLLKQCANQEDNVNEGNINGNLRKDPFVEFPELPEWPNYPNETGNIDIGTINSEIKLPDDNPGYEDSNGVHHYIVDGINLNGSEKVTITGGKKVTFYLRGNVNLSGNTAINHHCADTPGCKPTDFQIYGNNSADKYNGGSGSTVTKFCISGNSTTDAFIYAPDAKVGVNGGGSGDGFRGSIWTKKWSASGNCGSNANKTFVKQSALWEDLPLSLRRNTIDAPSSWQRKPVDK